MPVSPDVRRQIAAWLRPGRIVLLNTQFAPHEKFVIVAHVSASDGVWGFLINSEIHPFVASRPRLLACQVSIDVADHLNFLDYDSYADCSEVKDAISLQDVYTQLAAEKSRMKGHLSRDEVNRVRAAVQIAPKISVAQREIILAALPVQP